jgi:hypothetical protein
LCSCYSSLNGSQKLKINKKKKQTKMKSPQLSLPVVSRVFAALILMTVPLLVSMPTASAAQITLRKLQLEAGAADGGSKPGGVVNHFFTFTQPANQNVGSIKFEYCTTAANSVANPTCVAPTDVDLSTATLTAENGVTGFTNLTHGSTSDPELDDSNVLFIHKPVPANPGTGVISSYRLSGVTNPTTEGTFFVRISTYQGSDGATTLVDSGVVAASTAEQIILTGTMPESLVFCTGETVPVVVSTTIPDCANATAGSIVFDKLFSPTDTSISTSQMAASTNAGDGYAITVNGTTLTSGSNTIPAMNAMALGLRGSGQFGLNLRANTVLTSSNFPGDSADVSPTPDAVTYNGQPATGYDTIDQFKFTSGDVVANSNSDGTNGQIFTVSYMANVPGNQPAGTYATTLTYICTPTF